jgi:hypothetical protein
MSRGGFALLPVLAALLVSCTPAPRPNTTPTADREARALIEQLPSRFPPLFEDNTWGLYETPPDKARDIDFDRVQATYGRLRSMGITAFPALVAAIDDKRYSFSRVYAAWRNLTVGDACFDILESQVDYDGFGYKSRHGAGGRDSVKPQYLWNIRTDGKLKEWWAQGKSRSLAELQIESLRWTIAREQAIGFVSEEQRTQVLGPLLGRLKELGVQD